MRSVSNSISRQISGQTNEIKLDDIPEIKLDDGQNKKNQSINSNKMRSLRPTNLDKTVFEKLT